MIVIGQTFTFHSPYQHGPVDMSDENFAARKGTEAVVLGLVDPTTYDADEVGPMYQIRFTSDGAEIEAWPEEIE